MGGPGGHDVCEVDHLDEGLDGGALLDELLHPRCGLAHGLGDREWALGHACRGPAVSRHARVGGWEAPTTTQ